MKPRKPCKRCLHKKGGHPYNAVYGPGREFVPVSLNYPCQEKDCTCDDYVEMTNQELLEFYYGS